MPVGQRLPPLASERFLLHFCFIAAVISTVPAQPTSVSSDDPSFVPSDAKLQIQILSDEDCWIACEWRRFYEGLPI
jgi:hypothetical protein